MLVYTADSCLLCRGQSKWCLAGDGWKDHERSSYQLVTCAGRQRVSNRAPFYGSVSPASARCEWNCLGWCCPLSISLSAGSPGEAFHCGSRTLLSPWQPEIESEERKEGNKWPEKSKSRAESGKKQDVCSMVMVIQCTQPSNSGGIWHWKELYLALLSFTLRSKGSKRTLQLEVKNYGK